MTSAILRSVHSSVEYPAARAPFSNTSANLVFCSAPKRGSGVFCGLGFSPSRPAFSNIRFHPNTVEGEAFTIRATSRIPIPFSSMFAAISRRISNSRALPFGLIPAFYCVLISLRRSIVSGLIFCSHCGKPMVGGKAGKNRWRYYICSKKERDGSCDSTRLSAERIEQTIIDLIRDNILTKDNLLMLWNRWQAACAANTDTIQTEMDKYRKQLTGSSEQLKMFSMPLKKRVHHLRSRGDWPSAR